MGGYRGVSNIRVWMCMVKRKLLVERCRNGRYRREHRPKQQYQSPSTRIIGILDSRNYTSRGAMSESGGEIKRFRESNRSLGRLIDGPIGGISRDMGIWRRKEAR